MFLSDELTEIGRKSNPASNKSMAMAALKMQELVNTKLEAVKTMTEAQGILNSLKLAYRQLYKEKYSLFSPELIEAKLEIHKREPA